MLFPSPEPAGSACRQRRRWRNACSIFRPTRTVSQSHGWWGRPGVLALPPTTSPRYTRAGTAMPSADKRLRILTVTHNYPRFPGDPAGAFAARIAEGVVARGHQVRVMAPHAPG